jgi:hypothetical protein
MFSKSTVAYIHEYHQYAKNNGQIKIINIREAIVLIIVGCALSYSIDFFLLSSLNVSS